MVSNEDKLQSACDKFNPQGYGRAREQSLQFLQSRKRHNLSLFMALRARTGLLG